MTRDQARQHDGGHTGSSGSAANTAVSGRTDSPRRRSRSRSERRYGSAAARARPGQSRDSGRAGARSPEHAPNGGAQQDHAADASASSSLANAVGQNDDLVCEGGEPGELSIHDTDLIRAFAERAHQRIAPWAAQRETANLRFDNGPMAANYRSFTRRWLTDMQVQQGTPGMPVAFENDQVAVAEARRLLDRGTFRASVIEIMAFNPNALGPYADLLGITAADRLVHRYRLEIVGGAQAGAGEGVNVEVTTRRYDVFYDNAMGMSWTARIGTLTLGAGPGAGLSPVSGNIDVSGTYTGDARFYFSPEDFSGGTTSYITAGASLDEGSAEATAMIFENNGHRLEVSSVGGGDTGRRGTDQLGNAGVMVGGGPTSLIRTERTTRDLPAMEERAAQPPNAGSWRRMIVAMVFFRTGERVLDSEDRATLDDVVARMAAYDARHPGLLFRIDINGRASRRWRGVGNRREQAGPLNNILAEERAHIVQQALRDVVDHDRTEFSSGVIEASEFNDPSLGGQRGEDPDDDRQVDRSVVIAVEYNQCGPDGRVDGGLRL